jgi:hypothetical protein
MAPNPFSIVARNRGCTARWVRAFIHPVDRRFESGGIWRMDRKDTGANFQIIVDGKTRSYRDIQETA